MSGIKPICEMKFAKRKKSQDNILIEVGIQLQAENFIAICATFVSNSSLFHESAVFIVMNIAILQQEPFGLSLDTFIESCIKRMVENRIKPQEMLQLSILISNIIFGVDVMQVTAYKYRFTHTVIINTLQCQ